MTMRLRALPFPFGLMIASLAHAQTASSPPNVQTSEILPAIAPPAASPDPRGITTADSGSSIDKPATVGAMPQTGYHAPAIGKRAEPAPHANPRAGDRTATGTAIADRDARPDPPRALPNPRN